MPLREWIAEQHGVEVEQVLVTNGSMQADAFLFQLLVQPGDAVIVESPTYDRTLLNLRNRGADVRMVDAGDRRDRRRRARDRCSSDGAAPEARAHHPELPEPGRLHAERAPSARGCSQLAAEHDFTLFEDDPYIVDPLRGRAAADRCSRRTTAGQVVYASSFSKTVCPGIRVGYLVGPQAVIKQIQTIATNTYISPNMVAQSIVNQFARSGRMDGAIATVKDALRDAPRRGRGRARARAARGEVRRRRRAATSCGSSCPRSVDVAELESGRGRARACCSSRAPTSCWRAGENTLRLAYSGVTPEQIDEGITRLAEAVRSLGVAA